MDFAAFLSYVIITSFTPGPSNLLMMNEARRFGFKGSMHFIIGIISGFIILGAVTTLLTTRLYQWLPRVEPYFKVIGAAYLLYLAWKIALPKKSDDQDTYRQFSFFSGLLFQIFNVKSILFFLIAMSTFILPYHDSNGAVLFLMCLAILIGCKALLLWAIFGSAFKKIFTKYDKIINTIMCLLLIYSAVTIF
ncbi:threonine/homoserine/homoserine lactone efflux protein [Paenibacillus jamilae]|uniref:LysE family transporter n=1 Tax=Paenibacillus TaxID=44249 RepID=UPI000D2F5583|nr:MULTISPECIES: LysE family transporter [Paenibacillus]MDP9677902.1 threonine/homoserine/homoserine lactone efflux protein [Paenibacillus jamilae]KAF6617650.1 LysE family transporter [Paenibacillus sp. EKM101P]KAF6619700.1 LysE family transporter [Paenibacillus sp. EKM102P]KAF6627992.1 LysE family transporter [Paenibacillus sp. EKM10P]KAF6646205.1 LysE family transporter [Paenibacillus sp. EKM11P]